MKSSKKTIILFGAAIVFTVAMAGGYAGLFFAIKNKTVATTPVSEKIEELSGREARIASSLSILRREDANIEKLSNFFFKESEIVEFTKKVEALNEQSGAKVTLDSLEQGGTQNTTPFLNFHITATGTFSEIYRLVLLLENFPGKIEWGAVNLSVQSVDEIDPITNKPKAVKRSGEPRWSLSASLTARNFIN